MHHEAAQHEEEEDERPDIDGSGRARLFAPVLAQLLVEAEVGRVGFRHARLVLRQGHRGSSLHVGHQQREGLTDAVAPLRDVVALQSAAGLVGGIWLHQLALATHAFLAVLVRVVEVREIDAHAHQGRSHQYGGSAEEGGQTVFATGGDPEGNGHEQHDEQEIIAHLRMVGRNLQGHKKSSDQCAGQVTAPVDQHQTGNGGRDIGQGDHLPDVSGGNDDEEIGREGPDDGSQCRQPDAEVEGTEQQVEAQQEDEDIANVGRQEQAVDRLHDAERVARRIARSQLVGGHAAEQGIGPAGGFARTFVVVLGFLAGTDACHGIVLRQYAAFRIGREEVGKRDEGEQQDRHSIGKKFLQ